MVSSVLNADSVYLSYSAPPTKGFFGTRGPDVITGTGNADAFRAGGGGDTLTGLGGDDTYFIYDAADVVVEAANGGVDTINATVSYSLSANVENLTVTADGAFGGGNGLNNILVGGAGKQILQGGGGGDVVTGGAGADVFVLGRGDGHDVITDFQPSVDQVRLDGLGFANFAQVRAALSQVGADVLLSVPTGEQLWFRNHSVSEFARQDFQLSLDTSRLTQTFGEEFNSLSLYNTTTKTGLWWTAYGSAPTLQAHTLTNNGELQVYVDPSFAGSGKTPLGLNPFSISNGIVSINANVASASDSASLWGYQYTSGMLTTRTTFAQQYGYFETRAALPVGDGLWPAFWLLPTSQNGPAEIDIFEQLGRDPNNIYTTSHTNTPGVATHTTHQTYVANPDQFHTYGMLWDQDYLVWYVDGVEVDRQTTTPDMQQPMYMLLNLAVGGAWAGPPDAATPFPASYKIDYVRAYAINATPANTAPVASSDSYSVQQGGSLVVSGSGVLANDFDANGERINAALFVGPSHGALSLSADGSFTYTPVAGFVGTDSFQYKAGDGASMSAPMTVTLNVGLSASIPPTATAPLALSATEQTALNLKGSGLLIADLSGPLSTETLTLSVGEGALTVTAGSSGALVTGSGGGVVTVSGTVAQINALLTTDPGSTVGFIDPLDAPAASTALTLAVQDSAGLASSATSTIFITPVNDAPVAGPNVASVVGGGTLAINVASLLANDHDPDGDAMSIIGVSMGATPHGTVSLSNGVVTYTPAAGYLGTDSFTYQLSDGSTLPPTLGVVSVNVTSATPTYTFGGAGDDILDFSAKTNPQLINGAGGNDTIKGGSGADTLNGGAGNDIVIGGSGADLLLGGSGHDVLTGAAGADLFIFSALTDFSPASSPDVITDFSHSGGDRIQISGVDANSGAGGNQAFHFIGTAAFSHAAAELRYVVNGPNAMVYGDVNGDGVADFALQLLGVTNLQASDFLL